MLQVGLTGGIASGKSTVARMFREKGAIIFDFDELAHFTEEPDRPGWKAIVDGFGTDILNRDRSINRETFGAMVFGDKEKLAKLNRIIHPAIFEEWEKRVQAVLSKNPQAIMISDIPLLFETGIQHWFEVVILVYISSENQIHRLTKRNGYSQEEAGIRLNSQMSIDEKVSRADFVIHNEGSIQETQAAVDAIWTALLKRERGKK